MSQTFLEKRTRTKDGSRWDYWWAANTRSSLIKHTVVAQVRRTWTIQDGERSSYKYSVHSVPGYALSVLNTSLVREETNQEC